MAYDEGLKERISEILSETSGVEAKKMFGGVAFMIRGHMCCGVVKDELMVRVGPERYERALARDHARLMDFTGRPMKGMVMVSAVGIEEDEDLREWIDMGLAFVTSLPPK